MRLHNRLGRASAITDNADFGTNVVQEEPGGGLLVLTGVDLQGNGEGDVNAENVRVVRIGGRA